MLLVAVIPLRRGVFRAASSVFLLVRAMPPVCAAFYSGFRFTPGGSKKILWYSTIYSLLKWLGYVGNFQENDKVRGGFMESWFL